MKNSGYTEAISSWLPFVSGGLMDFKSKLDAYWRAFAARG
jgi:hypothetical protein